MQKKKPAPKKLKSTNGIFVITVLLVILLVISLGATFYFLFLRPGPTITEETKTAPPHAAAVNSPSPASQATPQSAPKVEEEAAPPSSQAATEPPSDTAPEPPHSSTAGPRLAILIDDIGNTRRPAEQMIGLDLPLAFSILPHSPHANHLAGLAKARGRDILLHLPMEANDPKWSPVPGTLLLSMPEEELSSNIKQALDSPYRPIGVNNHMGSKFSEDPLAMRAFLGVIKSRGLFFVDSLTAINSVGFTLARELGIKTAKRDIFMDNDQDVTKIMAQIGRAINLARKNGSAIAIGHPYPATLEALRATQTRLTQDITLVPIHELVE